MKKYLGLIILSMFMVTSVNAVEAGDPVDDPVNKEEINKLANQFITDFNKALYQDLVAAGQFYSSEYKKALNEQKMLFNKARIDFQASLDKAIGTSQEYAAVAHALSNVRFVFNQDQYHSMSVAVGINKDKFALGGGYGIKASDHITLFVSGASTIGLETWAVGAGLTASF